MSTTARREPTAYWSAVLAGPGSAGLRRRSFPTLAGNQVLVRVRFCGFCGKDLSIFQGARRQDFPFSPGHEYTGTVEAVGGDVRHLAVGDRVAINPNYVCGDCYFCQCEEYNLCEQADRGVSSNGGLAEYAAVDGEFAYRLPDEVGYLEGVLVEPLACCVHALQSSPPRRQRLAVIVGAGTMGLLVLESMRGSKLAESIVVSEPVARRRGLAMELGADHTVDPHAGSLDQAVRQVNPQGADIVVECSGAPHALEEALRVTRRGGEILLVGRPAEEAAFGLAPLPFAKSEITLRGSSRFVPEDMRTAMAWISGGTITAARYTEDLFPLSRVQDAFEHALAGRGIKTVIDCTATPAMEVAASEVQAAAAGPERD